LRRPLLASTWHSRELATARSTGEVRAWRITARTLAATPGLAPLTRSLKKKL